jgi:hypothetical protein
MKEIPDSLFERNIEDISISVSDIHLYSRKEIQDAQKGYRVDEDGNYIEEWIGDNYIVIGCDSCCGDPIIADLSDEKLPVYSMFHDDWSSLDKITDSFSSFIDILNKIKETDLSDENARNSLISDITKIVPKEGVEYWEALLSDYDL